MILKTGNCNYVWGCQHHLLLAIPIVKIFSTSARTNFGVVRLAVLWHGLANHPQFAHIYIMSPSEEPCISRPIGKILIGTTGIYNVSGMQAPPPPCGCGLCSQSFSLKISVSDRDTAEKISPWMNLGAGFYWGFQHLRKRRQNKEIDNRTKNFKRGRWKYTLDTRSLRSGSCLPMGGREANGSPNPESKESRRLEVTCVLPQANQDTPRQQIPDFSTGHRATCSPQRARRLEDIPPTDRQSFDQTPDAAHPLQDCRICQASRTPEKAST